MGLVLNTLQIIAGQPVRITSWTHRVPAGSGPNPVLSDAQRSARCNAGVDLIDGGDGPGYVRIYEGGAEGTPLVDIPVNSPCFGDAGDGVATADVSPEPEANAVATASVAADYYEVYDGDDVLQWGSANVSAATT